jgi:hypothetical protein
MSYTQGGGLQGLSNEIGLRTSSSYTSQADPKNIANSTLPEKEIENNRAASLNGDIAPLVFPSDLGDDYYISFNAFKYTSERPEELKRTFLPNRHIKLPLPSNLTDSYSSSYSSENLFAAGNALKEFVSSEINNKNGTNSLQAAGSRLSDPNYVANLGISALEALQKNAGKIAAGVAVQGLSGAGGPLFNAAKSSLQLTANPFPVMIFQGTGFKPPFTFDYTFYPESYEEAETIKSIIGLFRKNMLPELMKGNRSILKTPAIFEIKVTPSDILRRYKRCVLTNMGVSYSPSGISFIKDSEESSRVNPTATSLSLTFQEIEVWLGDDYSSSELYNYGPEEDLT